MIEDFCFGCNRLLADGERLVCSHCLDRFPLVFSDREQNPLWLKFCGKVEFEHATTLGYYQTDDVFARLIVAAKYGGRPFVNKMLTQLLLKRLAGSDWPYDIDVIVPVPVHWLRLLKRGYNQVSPVVHTLSKAWGIPVEKRCLVKGRYTGSQVGRNAQQRGENENGSFSLRHPERLEGKHVLLVDDVCTTGSTLIACADTLRQVKGVRVSFLTLGLTLSQ